MLPGEHRRITLSANKTTKLKIDFVDGACLAEDHVAGQILEIRVHGQRKAKVLGEERLRGHLRARKPKANSYLDARMPTIMQLLGFMYLCTAGGTSRLQNVCGSLPGGHLRRSHQ